MDLNVSFSTGAATWKGYEVQQEVLELALRRDLCTKFCCSYASCEGVCLQGKPASINVFNIVLGAVLPTFE